MSTYNALEKGASCIKDYVTSLPDKPGVYRMLNARSKVLYVGKAKSLKKRVNSYTRTDRLPLRLQRMVAETTQMTFVTTSTEVEALLLEANLIKQLDPTYNILLKDGKTFAYIKIQKEHPWPMIGRHRGPQTEPGTYFGPFASGEAITQTLVALLRVFRLRSCSDSFFANRDRPCLQYHIKRCSAPCVGYISADDYKQSLHQAKQFLRGKSQIVQKELAEQMQKASEALAYEQAAVLRDRIKALTHVQTQQVINVAALQDADIIAAAEAEGKIAIQVFIFRHGSHYGNRVYFPTHSPQDPIEDVLGAFTLQFYEGRTVPPQVLLSHSVPETPLLEEAFSQTSGHKVFLKVPQRGEKKQVVEHAQNNAKEALERRALEKQSQKNLLEKVRQCFDLSTAPQRIEIYDNSHIQGTSAIGAMVVAGPEGFIKSAYRKFNIKGTDITPGDDYGMMREVLTRRFGSHAFEKHETLPDLILIDGGAGQLSVAETVLQEQGFSNIPLVAIAKGPERNAGRETFYRKGHDPFCLPPKDPVLYFLQRLRDEAHRFAIGTHRAKRSKTYISSRLDDIPGIGPQRKKQLLRHFGSVKEVAGASIERLMAVDGMNQKLAEKIHTYFHS